MKNKNQYFAEVFSKLLKEWCKFNNRTQAQFAEVVGVHPNMISRYKKGEAYPTDDVIDWISQALNVDKAVFFPDKKKIAIEEIGRVAANPETLKKIERVSRIAKLSDVFQKLKKAYGAPDGWAKKSLADEASFIFYLDEQIEHAFNTYFKYVSAPEIDNEENEKLDTVMDGISEIISGCLSSIKEQFPQDMTDGEFFELIKTDENLNKVSDIVQNYLGSIGSK